MSAVQSFESSAAWFASRQNALTTFRFFLREVLFRQLQIIPVLAPMGAVKVALRDQPGGTPEYIWLTDLRFDGHTVEGALATEPLALQGFSQGQRIGLAWQGICDWMITADGVPYGAFTVQAMRSVLNRTNRAEHDAAWQLEFGDPRVTRLSPALPQVILPTTVPLDAGMLDRLPEHPLSQSAGAGLSEAINRQPNMIHRRVEHGWTMLHRMVACGAVAALDVLLRAGADANALTPSGKSALSLAQDLGWNNVVQLLRQHGAT